LHNQTKSSAIADRSARCSALQLKCWLWLL